MRANRILVEVGCRLRRFGHRIIRAAGRALEEAFPFLPYIAYACRTVRKANGEAAPEQATSFEQLSEAELGARLQEERQRGAAMDEKTFKMTLSLTFALTILGTLSPLLLERIQASHLRTICGTMIALTIFYALAGGFLALGAMRTLTSYGYGTITLPRNKPGARRRLFADALARNELIGLVRHMRNEAAYQSLRNGFVCLAAALAVFAFALLVGAATYKP